jgi:hypothetical protein
MTREARVYHVTHESTSLAWQVDGASEGVGSGGQLAMFKTDEIIQYHVGETICGLQKVTLTPGGDTLFLIACDTLIS